jgi:D-alanyl-D-alanine carboxypeptidase
MKETEIFKIIHKALAKYGFILRYPKGKEDITGYSYEPWHIRYVGVKYAKEIYKKAITLEEYLSK